MDGFLFWGVERGQPSVTDQKAFDILNAQLSDALAANAELVAENKRLAQVEKSLVTVLTAAARDLQAAEAENKMLHDRIDQMENDLEDLADYLEEIIEGEKQEQAEEEHYLEGVRIHGLGQVPMEDREALLLHMQKDILDARARGIEIAEAHIRPE